MARPHAPPRGQPRSVGCGLGGGMRSAGLRAGPQGWRGPAGAVLRLADRYSAGCRPRPDHEFTDAHVIGLRQRVDDRPRDVPGLDGRGPAKRSPAALRGGLGGDRSRLDHGDPYPVPGDFLAQRRGEAEHAELGQPVDASACPRRGPTSSSRRRCGLQHQRHGGAPGNQAPFYRCLAEHGITGLPGQAAMDLWVPSRTSGRFARDLRPWACTLCAR